MMNSIRFPLFLLIVFSLEACSATGHKVVKSEAKPVVTTDKTPKDTDDPAIWYNRENPEKSLILGTDKDDENGGIFVFNLKGDLDKKRSIKHLKRPNNIDIEYGFQFQGKTIDIAVFTERGRDMIRVISVPDCQFIDNGGIPVFEDDSLREPMGISLYKNRNNEIFAFVGRKDGPREGYLYQYKLSEKDSVVVAKKVRAFGKYSGEKEIESIVVDDELGYVYYSDENVGIRKYFADTEKGNEELALFATEGVKEDHEGLSIYPEKKGRGYIILSDQQANRFQVFSREGTRENPHDHQLMRTVTVKTESSDGSDIINLPLNKTFKHGLFVAMSSNRTFQYYRAEDIVGRKGFWRRIFD